MSFEWFVASRYLRAKGRTKFRSLITVLAVGGVGVGVAAAIIVLGVMNGFTTEVRGRIAGTNAHVVLLDPDESPITEIDGIRERVEAVEGVVATAPFVFGKVLLTSDREAEGAILRGMDREAEAHVTEVPARITPFDASLDLQETPDGEVPGIILGRDLMLRLRAGRGQTVVATIPSARRRGIPRMRTFVVTGFFESGIYDYDSSLALTSLESSRDALDLGDGVTGILVRVEDMDKAPEMGARILDEVTSPPLWANNWIRQNRQLFFWMKMEKFIGYLIFVIILVVAAFLIASTLIMIVLEKTREIGVLMSLGASHREVQRIFLLEGFAIGGVGTGVGLLVGWLGSVILDRVRFDLPGDVYFIETLPVEIWWGDFLIVGALSVVVCLLSALYPSWRASHLVPVEAIRYE